MTPREGEAVAEMVGAETTMDWVPAVVPFWHTTMTVYVPELTPDQLADCVLLVPVNGAWRPWAKFAWLLVSSEALPKLPLLPGQALVVTVTDDPLVLTEIPEPHAAADPAARVSGSAAAAATVRPERRSI
jgi:hypothetical protein